MIAVRCGNARCANIAKARQISINPDGIHQTLEYRKVDLLRISFSLGAADGRFMADKLIDPCLINAREIFEISFDVTAKRMKIHAGLINLRRPPVVREAVGKCRGATLPWPLGNEFWKQRLCRIATNNSLFEKTHPEHQFGKRDVSFRAG